LWRRFLVERTYTVDDLSRTIPVLVDFGGCRTGRSRLGGSCASYSMQLLALVMAAESMIGKTFRR
jgi:hypothetical protein